jgi:hypothetical protein
MSDEREFERFLEDCIEGLRHQVSGDSRPFLEVWSHGDDVAILGAVGSHTEGGGNVRRHLLGASQALDWTRFSVERVLTFVSGDSRSLSCSSTWHATQTRIPAPELSARLRRTGAMAVDGA